MWHGLVNKCYCLETVFCYQVWPHLLLEWTTFKLLGQNIQYHRTFCIFQNVHSFLVGQTLQARAVHREDLISTFQLSILCSCALGEDILHVDGQVAMWTAVTSNNGETQTVCSALQCDCFILRWGSAMYNLTLPNAHYSSTNHQLISNSVNIYTPYNLYMFTLFKKYIVYV